MSTDQPSHRRFALAISAAVASTTIAIGVTAGSLLGWFRPAAILPDHDLPTLPGPSEAPSEPGPSTTPTQPVIFVPIAPDLPPEPEAAPVPAPEPVVQLALHEHEHDADELAAEPAAERHYDDEDDDDDDDDGDDDHRGRHGDHDDHDDEEDDDDD